MLDFDTWERISELYGGPETFVAKALGAAVVNAKPFALVRDLDWTP